MNGKRGEAQSTAELWLLIAAFLIAAIAGLDLLADAAKRIDSTFLEQAYIARDLALAVDALVASPGDISYTYNLGSYNFIIDLDNSRVSVKSGLSDTSPATYRIVSVAEKSEAFATVGNPGGYKVFVPGQVTVRVPGECLRPRKLVLSKSFRNDGSSEITVAGKNILVCRAGDEGCRRSVIACE